MWPDNTTRSGADKHAAAVPWPKKLGAIRDLAAKAPAGRSGEQIADAISRANKDDVEQIPGQPGRATETTGNIVRIVRIVRRPGFMGLFVGRSHWTVGVSMSPTVRPRGRRLTVGDL